MADTPRLKKALLAAIAPQGTFAQVFAVELHMALPKLGREAAAQSAMDMLARRHAIIAAAPEDAPLEKPAPGLMEGKMEELVESLAQPRNGTAAGSADALIHIYANIEAQRDLHAALADKVYASGGRLEKALVTAMQRQDAGLPSADIAQAAADYIGVRRARAQGVVEALKPGGPAERQAVALATRLRREGDTAFRRSKETPPAEAPLPQDLPLVLPHAETPQETPPIYPPKPEEDGPPRILTVAGLATAAILGGLLAASAIPAAYVAVAWLSLGVAASIGVFTGITRKRHHHAESYDPAPGAGSAAPYHGREHGMEYAHTRDGWVERTAAKQPDSLYR